MQNIRVEFTTSYKDDAIRLFKIMTIGDIRFKFKIISMDVSYPLNKVDQING